MTFGATLGIVVESNMISGDELKCSELQLASVEDFEKTKIGSLMKCMDTLEFYGIQLERFVRVLNSSPRHISAPAYRGGIQFSYAPPRQPSLRRHAPHPARWSTSNYL